MNPNMRIHEKLVTERHQESQHEKTQHFLTLNQQCSEMSNTELAAHCLTELNNFRRGEPGIETYGVELLRRATVQGDQEAWGWTQQCLGQLVLGWLGRHPNREAACRLESAENYVAQAFERFWQATALTQHIDFNSFAGALRYLHACLNGAILDTLRAYSKSREIPLPEPGEPGELQIEDDLESSEIWDNLKLVLPKGDELRLAYLLFHCGLKPKEIMRFCPQEFSDVRDIYRLRNNIMHRLLRNADQLRWRLS
jgi:hypothetical protein